MGYLNLVGSFVYKEPLFRSKLAALANNDAQLKTDGWGQNTKAVFYQAAVPTGWTQDTSQNDKALRVVGSTGGGVAGGVTGLSSTITLAHTHTFTTPDDGSHTHAYADHTHQMGSHTSARQASATSVFDNSGFMFAADNSGGASSLSFLVGPWKTPGAITLSTQANHNHGTPASALTNFVFAYCDVIIGTKNAPGGTYTDLTAYFHTGDKIDFDPMQSFANNDAYNLGNLMPATTVMIFGQASAPTGWTKIAATNDRMLRIVSGVGGGTGGTQLISSGVSLNHTHAVTAVADHTHTIPNHSHGLDTGASTSAGRPATSTYGFIPESSGTPGVLALCDQTLGLPTTSKTVYKSTTTSSGSGNTSAAGGHTHVLPNALADFQMAYVDVIQCSKDASGSPYVYTDYTAEFAWKKLVTYQRLNTLAKNDEYIHFHTTPVSSQTFFYMSSPPTGWVKNISQHDKALRIVSGGTGGTPGGGSQLLSATISLAHTHSIPTQADHTHTADHTHPVASGTQTIVQSGIVLLDAHSIANEIVVFNTVGSPKESWFIGTTSDTAIEAPAAAGSHNHGGVTDSQLTNLVLAYADVIWCTKS